MVSQSLRDLEEKRLPFVEAFQNSYAHAGSLINMSRGCSSNPSRERRMFLLLDPWALSPARDSFQVRVWRGVARSPAYKLKKRYNGWRIKWKQYFLPCLQFACLTVPFSAKVLSRGKSFTRSVTPLLNSWSERSILSKSDAKKRLIANYKPWSYVSLRLLPTSYFCLIMWSSLWGEIPRSGLYMWYRVWIITIDNCQDVRVALRFSVPDRKGAVLLDRASIR